MKIFLGLIVLWPLAGFLINGLLRRTRSKRRIAYHACTQILASFIFSLIVFWQVKENGGQVVTYFDFISVDSFYVPFAFQIDQLYSIFLLIITGVGFLIHVYSVSYMQDESNV